MNRATALRLSAESYVCARHAQTADTGPTDPAVLARADRAAAMLREVRELGLDPLAAVMITMQSVLLGASLVHNVAGRDYAEALGLSFTHNARLVASALLGEPL